ncbi:MAG: type II toxin-antitoxin system HicA family toxin [Thermodesulfobacteriota bacterium]|nr:type II toxin-antitoxin system HicA family toxin [Thermodesulfobacteriota bacterium]
MLSTFGPVKRVVLIRCLRKSGFDGPYSGGRHLFMVKGDRTLTIPNPHQKDIGRELLARTLRQAGVSKEEWESL